MGLRFDNRQMASFAVDGVLFSLLMPGIYSVHNALAAFAVARALGVDDRSAAAAINTYRPEAMRSEIVPAGGLTLIVDCYNANPASMRFALETLSKMRCGGRRIAVLADMLELGPQAFLYHEELGRQARELLIDHIFGFGPLTRYTVERFGKGAWHFDDKEGLSKSLSETIKAGDIILFKGSRGMALEEVVDRIKKMF
jgi:UDP-N-acetylmuramoyl-tripeptide--D-alanyl-D-alanine ligase